MLLQIGVGAQNAPVASSAAAQEIAAKSSTSPLSNSSDPNKPLTTASDEAASSDAKAEASNTVAEPKVKPKNPTLDLRVAAREARMKERQFAAPDAEKLGDPVSFQATAYSLRGRTRMGTYVRRGVIAADPRVLPLGSVVQIKAGKYTGVYSVHDTGKKIKGKIVDVWMPSSNEARQFGRRSIKVQVLRLGHGKRTNKK